MGGVFLVLLSSIFSRKSIKLKRREKTKKCKSLFQDCFDSELGSECCEDLYCDVYKFAQKEKVYKYLDDKNVSKGKCKIKQGEPCKEDKENNPRFWSPCGHDSVCSKNAEANLDTCQAREEKFKYVKN